MLKTPKVLAKILDSIDTLYGTHFILKKAKRDRENIGEWTALCTRMKIHQLCFQVVTAYKKQELYQHTLARAMRCIKIHMNQIRKLNQEHTKENIQFLTLLLGLMALFTKDEC